MLGRQSLERYPGLLPYNSPGTRSEKQKLLLQRWLADTSKRGYSPEAFDAVIQRFREADFALGTSAMGRIVGVKDTAVRDKLIADAVAGRWPLSRVTAEIKRRRATVPRPGQGRTVRPVDGVRVAVRRLDEQVPAWLAQLDAIASGLGESTTMGVKVIEARDALNDVLKVAHSRQR